MRVLVTRAAEDAERTARALRARGHEAIIAPLRERVRLDPPWPDAPYDALIATSRNAFAGGPAPANLKSLPCFCVGEATALAAREAGFAKAEAAGENAGELAQQVLLRRLPSGARLFYLAGSPRRPELEITLTAAGHRVQVLERYRMARVPTLPPQAAEALAAGTLDAVLHFSAESALAFFALADQAALGQAALKPRHLCLSAAVAEALPAAAGRRIAARPREVDLLTLLAGAPPPPKCD